MHTAYKTQAASTTRSHDRGPVTPDGNARPRHVGLVSFLPGPAAAHLADPSGPSHAVDDGDPDERGPPGVPGDTAEDGRGTPQAIAPGWLACARRGRTHVGADSDMVAVALLQWLPDI